MEPAIYYKFKVNLIRTDNNGEIDFINEEKDFIEKEPIKAREKAIEYYENYISNFKDFIKILEKNDTTKVDEEISKRIKITKFDIQGEVFELPDFDSGMGIFMVVDDPLDEDKKGEKFMIYGIGFNIYDEQQLIGNLNFEFEYYKHFKYDTKNYITTLNFYDAEIDGIVKEKFLKTPYKWEKNEKKVNKYVNKYNNELFILHLINTGENNQIEFKSSLISYYSNGNKGYSRHIRFNIIKTIAAFLNSKGGFLLVGVSDDKEIIGLDNDFAVSNKENEIDYFNLEVDKILKENFKPYVDTNITRNFVDIGDKKIYYFKITPSKKGPVFITNRTNKNENLHKKEFYVRYNASSVLYDDLDDILNYCLNKWCNKE